MTEPHFDTRVAFHQALQRSHRFNQSSPLVPLGLDLGQHSKGEMRVVCAKSALGVSRVRAVAELLKAELKYAEKLSAEALALCRERARALC